MVGILPIQTSTFPLTQMDPGGQTPVTRALPAEPSCQPQFPIFFHLNFSFRQIHLHVYMLEHLTKTLTERSVTLGLRTLQHLFCLINARAILTATTALPWLALPPGK